jgi:hypothetical protein
MQGSQGNMEGSELNSEEMRRDLAEASSAKHMMEKILNLDQKTQLTIVMLLWLWWNERNKWREEGRRKTTGEIAYLTAYLTDRFQNPVCCRIFVRNSTGQNRSVGLSK